MNFRELKWQLIAILEKRYLPNQLSSSFELLEQAEQLIYHYLKKHPKNTAAMFMLALIETFPPLADDPQAIEILNKIIICKPDNYKVLLFLAAIEDKTVGVTKETFNQLQKFKTTNKDTAAMIEYAKSMYYFGQLQYKKEYEAALRGSIALSQKFSWNYIYLGRELISQGLFEDGCKYIKQGLANVQIPGPDYTVEASLDVDRFIDEYITGTQMSEANYEIISSEVLSRGC